MPEDKIVIVEARNEAQNIEEVNGLRKLAARLEVKEAGPRAEPWVPIEGFSYESWPGPGDSEGGGWD